MFTHSDIIKTLESTQRLIGNEHDAKLVEFDQKITGPLFNILPTKYPHLKGQVVVIQFDTIGTYLQTVNNNGDNDSTNKNINNVK